MDEADRIAWLKERIYRPKELVRARQLENGQWEVFDGKAIYTFDDTAFMDSYQIAAQISKAVKYDDDIHYEYHTT